MIKVVCGIIYNEDNEIFIARRRKGKSMAGKWEFPGGKLEDGEREPECLKRELFEELGMQVEIREKVGENIHHYDTFSIRLIAYRCTFISATYQKTDHDAYVWVSIEEFIKLRFG